MEDTANPSRELPVTGSGQDRHATWLELFFDLIFVIVISQITKFFVTDINFQTLFYFIMLFIPVWWSWTGHTLYGNRFEVDDNTHRILTFLQIFAALLMGIFVKDALQKGFNMFAVAYLSGRLILMAMYWRAYKQHPIQREIIKSLVKGFILAALVWGISFFLPAPYHLYVWALSLFIDCLTPLLIEKKLMQAPIHRSHLPERFGLFTIIVLGESMLATTQGIANLNHWQFFTGLNAIAGFTLIVLLWWLYFDYVELYIIGKIKGTGHPYIYLHFFIYIGIILIGSGIEYSILSHISTLATLANLLIIIGITLFIVPLSIIQGIYFAEVRKRTFVTPGLVFILFMVGLFFLEQHYKTFFFPSALLLPVGIYLFVQRRQFATLEQNIANATLGTNLF